MTSATWKTAKTGDFETGANWSTGTVPDGSTDVTIGIGGYTVSLVDGDADIRSLTNGATLSLAQGATLTAEGDSLNSGTIALSDSHLVLGGNLVNKGSITGEAVDGSAGYVIGGMITNAGGIYDSAAGTTAQLVIKSDLDNTSKGLVYADSILILQGKTSNEGRIEAYGSGIIVNRHGSGLIGDITNLHDGELDGGTWTVSNGGIIHLFESSVQTLTSGTFLTIIYDGIFETDDGNGNIALIQSTLSQVNSGATLTISGNPRFWNGFSVDGTLELAGALNITNGLTTTAGSLLEVSMSKGATYGAINGDAIIRGDLRVDGNGETIAMVFTGNTGIFGRVLGGGRFYFEGGDVTLAPSRFSGNAIRIEGANVTLGADLRFEGHMNATAGSIDLSSYSLRLFKNFRISGGDAIDGDAGSALSVRNVKLGSADGHLIYHVGATTIEVSGTFGVNHRTLLDVESSVRGGGRFAIRGHSHLSFGIDSRVDADQTIVFKSGRLEIAAPDTFHASIGKFGIAAHIDLTGFSYSGVTYAYAVDTDGNGGTLTIDSDHGSAALHFDGAYQLSDFSVRRDGRGGTVITYGPDRAVAPGAFHANDTHPGASAVDHFPLHAGLHMHELVHLAAIA